VYGARSMDKIVRPLAGTPKPFRRAYLPPPQVLSQHLDTAECFDEIFAGYRLFRDPKTLWLIAAAIKENYWRLDNKTKKGKRRNLSKNKFVKALAREDAWGRATNLAAAARLPEVLAVAGLKIEKDRYANALEREKIRQHILHPHHLHNMAREEHNLWMAFSRDNDWGYIDPESDHLKKLTPSDRKKEIKRLKTEERLHTLLIPFDDLPEEEKEKDYDAVQHYQEMADLIGYKITFMTAEW